MCTVVWGQSNSGLWLCFNRDEQRSRGLAEQPRLHEGPNGPVAYARDPDGGGTWLAVSAGGFAIGLLNAYPKDCPVNPPGQRSRGQLVRTLAEAPSVHESENRLSREDLGRYAPFYLLVCDPNRVKTFHWNGTLLGSPRVEDCFWTTSSFDPEVICTWRHDWWRQVSAGGQIDPGRAGSLLRQTDPERPAHAPTMDREDARTVSQVELELNAPGFTYRYRARETAGPGYKNPVILSWPD
jgi:hypothetical protein